MPHVRSRHGGAFLRATHVPASLAGGTVMSAAAAPGAQVPSQEQVPGSAIIPDSATRVSLEDEFSEAGLTPAGFTGAWGSLFQYGLYNATLAGPLGDVPDGRTAALPFWAVSRVGGATITRLADPDYPGGTKLRVQFSAANEEVRMRSDLVPVIGGSYFVTGAQWEAVIGPSSDLLGSIYMTGFKADRTVAPVDFVPYSSGDVALFWGDGIQRYEVAQGPGRFGLAVTYASAEIYFNTNGVYGPGDYVDIGLVTLLPGIHGGQSVYLGPGGHYVWALQAGGVNVYGWDFVNNCPDFAGGTVMELLSNGIIKAPNMETKRDAATGVTQVNCAVAGTWYRCSLIGTTIMADYAGQKFFLSASLSASAPTSTAQTLLCAIRVDQDASETIQSWLAIQQERTADTNYHAFSPNGVWTAPASGQFYVYVYVQCSGTTGNVTFYGSAEYASQITAIKLPG